MKTTFALQIRAFPVVIRDERTGEEHGDIIVLDKPRLQAAQLVGQSSKELIERIYHKQGFKVLEVGKADKMTVQLQLICFTVESAGNSAKDGSRELAIFDSAVSATNYGLGKDYGHATRMDSHMDGWLSGFEESMNNLPLIPEEMAPTGADAE